ncbi:MAG: NAD-dependent deacetylase [Phenylobacterium sp.]|jgi:NAD-dependent deacetylase
MNIVILTGAGVSAESGIKTFRAADGLWEDHKVEDVATPEAFVRDPELVYRFYNQRRQQLCSDAIKPNVAHQALADFAASSKHQLLIVTQNIDNLHERAGSKNVIHMHGELLKAKCVSSGKSMVTRDDFDGKDKCQCCNPAQAIRPDIVWFGEIPYHMDSIETALLDADLFISLGTSGNVYPAAGFVALAHQAGVRTVELNLEPSNVNSQFDEHHYGLASQIVPEFLATL